MSVSRQKWTIEELGFLREKYEVEGLSYGEIALLLGRTRDSIHIRVTRMGLRHTKEQQFYVRSKNHVWKKLVRVGD